MRSVSRSERSAAARARRLVSAVGTGDLTRVTVCTDEDGLAERLRRTGPHDVIVTDVPQERVEAVWRLAHPHLREGGVFVHRGRSRSAGRAVRRRIEEIAGADDDAWSVTVGTVRRAGRVVAVEKAGSDRLMLSHADATEVLARRRDGIRVEVLAELPAGRYEHRAQVTSHHVGAEPIGLLRTIEHPTQHLRHYTGPVVVANGSMVHAGQVILPDSFRYYAHGPDSPRMSPSVPGFARLDAKRQPRQRLEGDFYLLDSFFPGHFGHHSTEVVSRLWGWDEAKRRLPDLKALYTRWGKGTRENTFEEATFTAYGIDPADLVEVRRPVEVSSLVAATNMWHNKKPHFTHPDMQGVWHRLGDALADVPAEPSERVFVSRAEGKRGTHNLAEVERYFSDHGFEVVYPERLSLERQVGVMQEARVVAGIAGSALFNVMFARHLTQLIVLSSDTYTARNEHLFSSLLGGRLDYFWSAADIPHPPGAWSHEAFTSSWSFDFARHRAALDGVMDRLDADG